MFKITEGDFKIKHMGTKVICLITNALYFGKMEASLYWRVKSCEKSYVPAS